MLWKHIVGHFVVFLRCNNDPGTCFRANMLLGAWGKTGVGSGATAGGAPMNPTTPIVPHAAEQFPSVQRRRSRLRYAALVVAFALYLLLGAFVISSIEAPGIERLNRNVQQLREKFLGRHPNVKGEWVDGVSIVDRVRVLCG